MTSATRSLALVVMIVALGCKFFTRGRTTFAGYLVGIATGAVNFGSVGKPTPFKYGLEFNIAAIIGLFLISIVSAIETVGDISAIAKGGAGHETTDQQLAGGTYADGLGGGVILMFGMVVSAGVSMLSTVEWSRRKMMILATSMLVGVGLQTVPKSMQHLPETLDMLMTSGLLPVAVLSVVMNLLLPADAD